MSKRIKVLCLLLAISASGSPLLAADGRIEINQSSIDAAGGFPYTLSVPGSYVLTSNLLNPSKDIDALVIAAERVQLDLNGFRIKGPISCTPTCSDSGSGAHIVVQAPHGIIRNGTLRGAGGNGISVYPDAIGLRLERVRLVENGVAGIDASGTSGVVILYSAAYRNGGDGFFVGPTARIEENIMAENGAGGVAAYAGARIARNYIAANGHSGIKSFGASTVLDNLSINNLGHGMDLNGNSGYGGNLVNGNINGTISLEAPPNSAQELSPNACNGNTTCP